MTRLSIIIVTWNGKEYVRECLDSLRSQLNDPETEVIVVDNASTDGAPELIEAIYPSVRLIRNASNLGFARANNVGIRNSSGEFLCLVNSDVRILDGCIEKLLARMADNPHVGMCGPKMLDANGCAQRSYMGAPSLWNHFCRCVALDVLFPHSRVFGGFLMPYFNRDRIADVDVLNGWFWMIRRSALDEVGLLDEEFFMYGEDIDWCKRFHNAEWRVVYCPDVESIHYGGASSAKAPVRFYIERQRANFQYWKKHHGRLSQLAYYAIECVDQAVRVMGYLPVLLAPNVNRAETSFKIRRSWFCMLWMLGIRGREGAKTQ
jgi:GT2 family glycosyltransferase